MPCRVNGNDLPGFLTKYFKNTYILDESDWPVMLEALREWSDRNCGLMLALKDHTAKEGIPEPHAKIAYALIDSIADNFRELDRLIEFIIENWEKDPAVVSLIEEKLKEARQSDDNGKAETPCLDADRPRVDVSASGQWGVLLKSFDSE